MSLKAKIEAVIYAAEEPVTLPQLVSLLGEEAQAELDRQASAQAALPLDAEQDPADPFNLVDGADRPAFSEDRAETPSPDPATASPDPVTADPDSTSPNQAAADPDQVTPAPEQGTASAQPSPDEAAPASADAPPPSGLPESATTAADPAPTPAHRDERERARRLRDFFRQLLDDLIRDYSTSDRGLEIREVAGGFRLATKPEYHDAVRGFAKSLKPPLRLSLQALETLAVVAYKQPVTAPEISEIRGVDSGGVLGSLMARKLITTAGRKQVIGRPILYKTTKDFLLRFGLKDISELPSIEEFEKMAGELAEPQEEIPMQGSTSFDGGAESPHTDPELTRGGYGGVESPGIEPGTGGSSIDNPPPVSEPPPQNDVTEPQPDGDSEPLDTPAL